MFNSRVEWLPEVFVGRPDNRCRRLRLAKVFMVSDEANGEAIKVDHYKFFY